MAFTFFLRQTVRDFLKQITAICTVESVLPKLASGLGDDLLADCRESVLDLTAVAVTGKSQNM